MIIQYRYCIVPLCMIRRLLYFITPYEQSDSKILLKDNCYLFVRVLQSELIYPFLSYKTILLGYITKIKTSNKQKIIQYRML